MAGARTGDVHPDVKVLIEGFSTQSKLSNRLWISLFFLIVVVLIPTTEISSGPIDRKTIFGIGPLDKNWFDIVSFFVLIALSIAYCQAQAQAARGYAQAHSLINDLQSKDPDEAARQRLYLDLLSTPTLTRVGPLPVLLISIIPNGLKGSFVFVACAIYYVCLKILSISVQVGLPLVAVFIGWNKLHTNESFHEIIRHSGTVCGAIACVGLLQIFLIEAFNIARAARRMSRGEM